MTTPHCPGPWKVFGTSIRYIDHGRWLAVARASNAKFTPEGNSANARLIASAPELLSALQSLTDNAQDALAIWGKGIEMGTKEDPADILFDLKEALTKAEAAIEKAKK